MTTFYDSVKYGLHLWRCAGRIQRPAFGAVSEKKINQAAIEFIALIGSALATDPSTTEGVTKISESTKTDPRYIYRWRKGEHAPSLENVVSMLRSANLLRSPGEAAGEPESVVAQFENHGSTNRRSS